MDDCYCLLCMKKLDHKVDTHDARLWRHGHFVNMRIWNELFELIEKDIEFGEIFPTEKKISVIICTACKNEWRMSDRPDFDVVMEGLHLELDTLRKRGGKEKNESMKARMLDFRRQSQAL